MALICYLKYLLFRVESRAFDCQPYLGDFMSTTSETPNTTGREPNGRFAKGNHASHGNPFARQVAELRRLVLKKMSPENLEKLIDKLYEDALQGDKAAARLLLQYSLGQPSSYVDPDTMDRHEWEMERERIIPPTEFEPCITSMPLTIANVMHSSMRLANQDKHGQFILEGFARQDEEKARKAAQEQKRRPKVKEGVIPLPKARYEDDKPAKKAGNRRQQETGHRHPTGSNGDAFDTSNEATARDDRAPIVDRPDR
jgi:hypothetical protein